MNYYNNLLFVIPAKHNILFVLMLFNNIILVNNYFCKHHNTKI